MEAVVAAGVEPFPTVDKCDVSGLGAHSSVVADLDGTLLRCRSAFQYYALVAFETGVGVRVRARAGLRCHGGRPCSRGSTPRMCRVRGDGGGDGARGAARVRRSAGA